MKQSTIDTMLEIANGIRALPGMDIENSRRLDEAIEDLKAEKKEEVWIPPKGFIFNDADGLPRRSTGKFTGDGQLIYEGVVGNFCTRRWTRTPNLSQWIKHDGKPECPCLRKPVHILFTDGTTTTWRSPLGVDWSSVAAWHYADDLVIK